MRKFNGKNMEQKKTIYPEKLEMGRRSITRPGIIKKVVDISHELGISYWDVFYNAFLEKYYPSHTKEKI